jgi:polynucleotide 5'-kinase involved in rRNA processing
VVLRWDRLAIWPTTDFTYRQLVALEDADGFVLGLGIVDGADVRAREVTLLTPLASPEGVEALRLGDLTIGARTWEDQKIADRVPIGYCGLRIAD